MSLAFKKDCVNFGMVYEVGNKKWECSNIKGFILCVMSSWNSARWLPVNKYTKNFACKSGGKFTGLCSLGRFLGVGGNLSICKLQFEFVATAAVFAIYIVVRAELLPFSFDYGVKLCMQAASTAHSLLQHLYTLLYLQGVCVSAARAISQGAERELGSSLQLFSARGINRSARFCSLGSGYWFLHKVIFVLQ